MSRPRPKPAPGHNREEAIDVRVIPRAGRTEITGVRDGALVVRLAAAPVDGTANVELIDVIARALHIPKRDVTIVTGERSKQKRIRIQGIDRQAALARLIEEK
jgi:uncharacterized protein (TIGR00251 family)